jgi:hypothetical protein
MRTMKCKCGFTCRNAGCSGTDFICKRCYAKDLSAAEQSLLKLGCELREGVWMKWYCAYGCMLYKTCEHNGDWLPILPAKVSP